MTDLNPAAQIAVNSLGASLISMENVRKIVDALHAAGWLCPPAELAALRAVVATAQRYRDPAVQLDEAAAETAWQALNDALDAVPQPDGPRCRYCAADCTDGRSWDGGDLYACPPCARLRADWTAQILRQTGGQVEALNATALRLQAELDTARTDRDDAERRLVIVTAEHDRLRGELAAAEGTIRILEDPPLRAALSEPTSGDYGPVPYPEPAEPAEVTVERLRLHLAWAADRLQSAGLAVDANVARGIAADSAPGTRPRRVTVDYWDVTDAETGADIPEDAPLYAVVPTPAPEDS